MKLTISDQYDNQYFHLSNPPLPEVSNDGPVQTRPTICEVLQAAATLNRYIDELDDPIAPKLETNLGSFKYQLC